jgi:hypothetical protein
MFHPNTGKGQFLITDRNIQPRIELDKKLDFGGITLHLNPPLNTVPVKDESGADVGLIIGYPIDLETPGLLKGALTLDGVEPDVQLFEDALYALAGRYVALYNPPTGSKRLYVDSAGSLSCLYNASKGVVASTIELVEDITLEDVSASSERWAQRWLEARRNSGNWFPAGLGPIDGWKVVIPNHYLDFRTWEIERHWLPGNGAQSIENRTTRETIKEISEIVERQVEAITQEYQLRIPLTAGQDSRSLLACSRHFLSDTDFCLSWSPDRHDVCDVLVGNFLAEMFGLEYIVNPTRTRQNVEMAGFGGEVGRGFYWHQRDRPTTEFDVCDVIRRLGYTAKEDELDKAICEWFEGVNHLSLEALFDVMYIEQRLGCCFGPVVYSREQSAHFALFPFNHRRLYTLMTGLPLKVKQRGNLGKEIVRHQWEELGYVPYNRCNIGVLERASLLVKHLTGSLHFADRAQDELFRQYASSPRKTMTDLVRAKGVQLA